MLSFIRTGMILVLMFWPEPMWETTFTPLKFPSYLPLILIFADCHKATVQYFCAAEFYHNSGVRHSLWKMVWSILWHPLVRNVPWKCKSCHWLSGSTWPSRSVLTHYWGRGWGGQQGKIKEKANFSFHLEGSYLQASIQYPPGTGAS